MTSPRDTLEGEQMLVEIWDVSYLIQSYTSTISISRLYTEVYGTPAFDAHVSTCELNIIISWLKIIHSITAVSHMVRRARVRKPNLIT